MVNISVFCYKRVFSGLARIEIDSVVVVLKITREFYESSCVNRLEANGTQGHT